MSLRISFSIPAILFYVIFPISIFAPVAYGAIPSSPTGLSAIVGNSEASLKWDPVAGVNSYVIYRSDTSGGPFQFVGQTATNGHADQGLTNGDEYHYVVTALNGDGESPFSFSVSVVPTPVVLKSPENIRVIPGNGAISLLWKAVTSAVVYNIYKISPNGIYTQITSSATGVSFTDRSVTNGALYHYVVQTMSTNPGAYSSPVAVSPSGLLPAAPASLTLTPGSTWAHLSWPIVTGASRYVIYRMLSNGIYQFCGTVTGGEFEETGLDNDTTYNYLVKAVNENGASAFSPRASGYFSALERPHAAILSGWPRDTEVSLDWNAAAGAVTYGVYRKICSMPSYPNNPIATLTATSYMDSGSEIVPDGELTNGVTYCYLIKTFNQSSATPLSNEIEIEPNDTISAPTNIHAFSGNTEVTITWDPLEGGKYYWVKLYTLDGTLVKTRYSTQYSKPSCTITSLTNGQSYYANVSAHTSLDAGVSINVNVQPTAISPMTIQGLAGEAGNGQVSLRWPEITGATGYYVYRRTIDSAYQPTTVSPLSEAFFIDSGLTNGTYYYYNVAAVNGSGTGAWRASDLRLAPEEGYNITPIGLSGVSGNTQATFNWEPLEGAESYRVQVAEVAGGEAIDSEFVHNGRPSVTVKNLTNNKDYYFRVQSTAGGPSSYTAYYRITPRVSLPQSPNSLLGAGASGNTQVSLVWNAVNGATSYKIYRRAGSGDNRMVFAGNSSGTFFQDTGLENHKKYYHSVSAVNSFGEGPLSSYEAGSTPTSSGALAPTYIDTIPGNTEATITWKPVVGALRYYVTLADTPGGRSFEAEITSNGKTSATLAGLMNGHQYYARVRALSPSDSAEFGDIGVIPSADLPFAPERLTCSGAGNTEVTLTWNAVDGATEYRVYRRILFGEWSSAPVGTSVKQIYTDTNLINGEDYFFIVAAVNDGGSGAWARYDKGCFPSENAPLTPGNVVAVSGDGQVHLSWNSVAGATQYIIHRATSSGGPYTPIYVTGTEYLASSLTNGQSYFFRVQARFSSSLKSAYTDELHAIPTNMVLDSDNDGILDSWEIFYFGSITACSKYSDFDKDGYTDLQEFLNQESSLVDPYGNDFNPKMENAPWGPGYFRKIITDGFWNMMLPAILSSESRLNN